MEIFIFLLICGVFGLFLYAKEPQENLTRTTLTITETTKELPQEIILKSGSIDPSRIEEYQGAEFKKFEFRPKTLGEFIGQEEAKARAITIIKKAQRGMKSHFLINGIQGGGKCHVKGTGIIMADGTIQKIENLLPGDKIMGLDSKPKKVIKIGSGYGNMYEIIPTKGEKFIVNGEHILSLQKTGTKEILNISVLNYLNSPTTIRGRYELYRMPVKFKAKYIPLSPYFLGLWLGDGSSATSRTTNTSPIIWNWLKTYAKKIKLVFYHAAPKNRADYINISSGYQGKQNKYNIVKILRKLNLINNKHIPHIYKCNSRKNRLELLAGLMDSDGWLHNGCYEIVAKSNILAKDIKFLAQSLGFFSYITYKHVCIPSWNKKRRYNLIHIIGDCSVIPVKLTYKKAEKRKINKNPLLTGFKIKQIKKDKYYGFELDGNHLYMIDNFIVNHNTTFVEIIGNMLGAKIIRRIGKQIDEEGIINIINEINNSMEKHVLLFVDELDTMDSKILKIFNPVIESFELSGKRIKPFIFAGATINKHKLIKNNPDTLDRIGTHIKFNRYSGEDIIKIIQQYKQQLYNLSSILEANYNIIASNCKFNPRISIALLEDLIIENNMVQVLKNSKIIIDGLTATDIDILTILTNSKRPLGANSLAMQAKLTEKEYIIEYESYLVEYGYINRIPSRVITEKGKEVLKSILELNLGVK